MRIWERIERQKRIRNAVILAHVYQRTEVQGVADFVGGSLELSRKKILFYNKRTSERVNSIC